MSFVLQGELNKLSSENGSVENGNQTEVNKAIDKTGTTNTKHHLLLLQVNSRPGISECIFVIFISAAFLGMCALTPVTCSCNL